MFNNNDGRSKIAKAKLYMIIDYYNELYNNFDMKSIPKMAEELEIGESTLRLYLDKMYTGKNSDGKYSKISLRILLCTKFGTQSSYYEDQQELISIIKKREIVKTLRNCKQKNKVK